MDKDQSSIDDILGDLGDFSSIEFEDEKTLILLIGRKEIGEFFTSVLTPDSYSYFFAENLEAAADLLLRNNFALILLDKEDDLDISSISNRIRTNYAMARLILLYSGGNFDEVVDMFNGGSFDSVITLPAEPDEVLKRIIQQEARYHIQKEVTSFVAEPPKMSKASFLLLDPSLSFGDQNLPLNFVGVMVVHDTVPKYSIFFEQALNQDEILFSAFLASITTLGDELFQAKQSFKEIHFGGISVIFRFHERIQFAFLVENLTRTNYEKADKRIDEIFDKLIPEHERLFTKIGLNHEDNDLLDEIFTEFDSYDQVAVVEYEKKVLAEQQRKFGKQLIIFLSEDIEDIFTMISYLRLNEKIIELNYDIKHTNNLTEASNWIAIYNTGILVLDESMLDPERPEESGLFLAESIEELDPAVQIIYVSADNVLDQFEIDLLNSGNVDYIHKRKDHKFKIFASFERALKKSLEIRESIEKGTSSTSRDGLSVAKSMLKENLEAFDSEEKPALQGVVIAQNKVTSIDPIFSKFYIVDGELINFDVEMMAGLVTSLKQISGEMFDETTESINDMEVAGHDVFVRFNSDFIFIYFVKNISVNTGILIAKEIDAVSLLYAEIISESLGFLSADDLEPIFSKIALETHNNLTALLEVHDDIDDQ